MTNNWANCNVRVKRLEENPLESASVQEHGPGRDDKGGEMGGRWKECGKAKDDG